MAMSLTNGTRHSRPPDKDSHRKEDDKEKLDRQRKEDLARKQHHQHQAHQQHHHQQQHHHDKKKHSDHNTLDVHRKVIKDNQLTRETPFDCNIYFKSELPEIPGDPKLLISEIKEGELSEFSLTTLELEPRRDLVLSSDLGIPITLLDVERFRIPENAGKLDPKDLELLGEDESKKRVIMGAAPTNVRMRPHLKDAKLSWLMRTTYISNEAEGMRRPGYNEKKARALEQNIVDLEDDIAAQIRNIEASFEAAQQPPVHAKKPELTAVEVLPVLPDVACWENKYLQLAFDADPTTEVPELSRLDPEARKVIMAQCVLKGFQSQGTDKFMAFMRPKDLDAATILPLLEREIPVEEFQQEFVWCKEYQYTLKRAKDAEAEGGSSVNENFLLRFRPDCVTFCDWNGRMELKRKKSTGSVSRPSHLTIKYRPPFDQELEDRAAKLRKLYGHDGEEGEEAMDA